MTPNLTLTLALCLQVRSTSAAETLLLNHIVADLQLPVHVTAPETASSLAGFPLTIRPGGVTGGFEVRNSQTFVSFLLRHVVMLPTQC